MSSTLSLVSTDAQLRQTDIALIWRREAWQPPILPVLPAMPVPTFLPVMPVLPSHHHPSIIFTPSLLAILRCALPPTHVSCPNQVRAPYRHRNHLIASVSLRCRPAAAWPCHAFVPSLHLSAVCVCGLLHGRPQAPKQPWPMVIPLPPSLQTPIGAHAHFCILPFLPAKHTQACNPETGLAVVSWRARFGGLSPLREVALGGYTKVRNCAHARFMPAICSTATPLIGGPFGFAFWAGDGRRGVAATQAFGEAEHNAVAAEGCRQLKVQP